MPVIDNLAWSVELQHELDLLGHVTTQLELLFRYTTATIEQFLDGPRFTGLRSFDEYGRDLAHPNEPPDIDVRLVSVAIESGTSNDLVALRFWSDGTVEANRKSCGHPAVEWCGWEVAP